MSPKKTEDMENTKRLMGALIRMPPKAHEDMKIHKDNPSSRKPGK